MVSVFDHEALGYKRYWFVLDEGIRYVTSMGWGNSTVVSVSVYQAGDPGSRRLDPLVLERWNSITVLLTCSHQCRRLVQKRQSMCYYFCVIMHVKDP